MPAGAPVLDPTTYEAIAGWRAAPRTTRGGQAWYSPLAILTALTLRAVFHLALRRTEGLIGSITGLLGLTLAVPGHSTLSRRAETLEVPQLRPSISIGADPVHQKARHEDTPMLAEAARRQGRRHGRDRCRRADDERCG